jgi:hypothetical protein
VLIQSIKIAWLQQQTESKEFDNDELSIFQSGKLNH